MREIGEVVRLFPRSRLVPLPGLTGLPPSLEVPHRGLVILPRFALDHPFSPPLVLLLPGILSRHYYVHPGESEARLCYCRPEEWSPRFRLVHAVTAAMRFINDWRAHRVN
jgi:hypothetical protein